MPRLDLLKRAVEVPQQGRFLAGTSVDVVATSLEVTKALVLLETVAANVQLLARFNSAQPRPMGQEVISHEDWG